ncbi:hypothetical protein [Chryseobacterium pennipullorum]|uniref:DUF4440 domain-containing protein n=1 Tax=Chryseobacterium pennipullorum TaxID=2258963 RepID=A0A3D9AZ01_9FLAO|nr:hypothetical protein [Chryseobacterium pennipullorum]REC46146.1 hypothetical protein DRF67_15440 [Chryseobacterium pennipullorum]
MKNTEKIILEITEFHSNIEKWFQGKTDSQEALYETLVSGFSPEFSMINGNGDTVTLQMLSDWLPTVFGKFPERRIQLENIVVENSDHHGLATYVETQVTGANSNKRQSSAVFVVTKEKALWLHLVEVWM